MQFERASKIVCVPIAPIALRRIARLAIFTVVCAVMAFAPVAQVVAAELVDHAFGFDMWYDGQDAEVLDYRYGESKLPVRAPEAAVREGKPLMSTYVSGPMRRGESLYVKWRNKNTGEIYEDTVDLRERLPEEIAGHKIHFMIKGAQLYVYLISLRERRVPEAPAEGPRMYRSFKTLIIYPDQPKS